MATTVGTESTYHDLIENLLLLEHDAIAARIGAVQHPEGDRRRLLTSGKVVLASPMGDSAILGAMRTPEEDTVAVHERSARHAEAPGDVCVALEHAHQDELRHRAWMSNPNPAVVA